MKIGQVVRDVPVPEAGGGKYGWLAKLEVGDSVGLELEPEENALKVKDGVGAAARRLGIKVVVARDEAGDLRVWRVEVPAKKRVRRGKKVVEEMGE